MGLAPGVLSTTIDRERRSCIRDWTAPLIALAARSPDQARAKFRTGQGAQRVDRMRALIDPFVVCRSAVAEADRARVSHAVTAGMNAGFCRGFAAGPRVRRDHRLPPSLCSRADPAHRSQTGPCSP
jgi:hypothetical protein